MGPFSVILRMILKIIYVHLMCCMVDRMVGPLVESIRGVKEKGVFKMCLLGDMGAGGNAL